MKQVLPLIALTLLALVLTGCGRVPPPNADQVDAAIEATVTALVSTIERDQSPQRPSYTPPPTCTPRPTYTPLPTYTPMPTYTPLPTYTPFATLPLRQPTPTAEAAPPEGTIITSVDQTQDRGGVVITVNKLLLMSKEAFTQLTDIDEKALDSLEPFQGAQTMGALGITVRNETQVVANVYPDQGTLIADDEQIDLANFLFFSDDLGGEIYPGVTKEGAIVFALKRRSPNQVEHIRFIVDVPFDENWDDLAQEPYTFDITIR